VAGGTELDALSKELESSLGADSELIRDMKAETRG